MSLNTMSMSMKRARTEETLSESQGMDWESVLKDKLESTSISSINEIIDKLTYYLQTAQNKLVQSFTPPDSKDAVIIQIESSFILDSPATEFVYNAKDYVKLISVDDECEREEIDTWVVDAKFSVGYNNTPFSILMKFEGDNDNRRVLVEGYRDSDREDENIDMFSLEMNDTNVRFENASIEDINNVRNHVGMADYVSPYYNGSEVELVCKYWLADLVRCMVDLVTEEHFENVDIGVEYCFESHMLYEYLNIGFDWNVFDAVGGMF